jgi:hypothetical protein
MANTPNSGIPMVPEGVLDPAAGLNQALIVIDALLQTAVISMSETAPPGTNADGDLYIVASPATGDWTGLEDYLVRYVAEGDFWQAYAPGSQVKLVLNFADNGLYKWNATNSPGGWELAAGLSDAPSDGVGYVRKDGNWEPESSGSATPPEVVVESGTNLNATPANAGEYTRFTNSGAKTYTFDDGEGYSVGAEYHGRNVGAGDLTLTAVGGMTLNAPVGGSLVVNQGGTFTVKIVATDEADVIGVTEAP